MHVDILLRDAAVYTLDAARPRAGFVAIADGLIVALGDGRPDDDLMGPRTRVFDLGGRAVVPGFVDAHLHFGSYALAQQEVDLDASATLDDGLAVLRAAAERLPATAWLRGRGWDRNRWGRLPVAADLDSAIGNQKAALASLYAAVTRQDRHGAPAGGWYPEQRLTLEAAVRAYTSGSAAAERASRRRGRLALGKDADLVVLAPDPFPLDPEALRETRVELTMVGRRITFEGGSTS